MYTFVTISQTLADEVVTFRIRNAASIAISLGTFKLADARPLLAAQKGLWKPAASLVVNDRDFATLLQTFPARFNGTNDPM